MVIISQDKKSIILTETLKAIEIKHFNPRKADNEQEVEQLHAESSSVRIMIGEYTELSDAMDQLNKIANLIAEGKKIYYMPMNHGEMTIVERNGIRQ